MQKVMRLLSLITVLAASAGCVSTQLTPAVAPPEIVLHKDSVRIEGWFSARGEWMVSPGRGEFDSFNPLEKPMDQRCVSVVNATGSHRSNFAALDGKRVIVTGVVMDYYDLPLGPTYVDRLTQKRYYRGEVVFNACLRDAVFIASSIQLSGGKKTGQRVLRPAAPYTHSS